MSTRTGVELSPVACRIVELDGPVIVPGRPQITRVRSYAVLPPSGPETDRQLALLRRRSVAVVVWGGQSDHHQVVVSNGSYETMRTEALASVRAAGVDTAGTVADITASAKAIKGASRQPVVLALASANDLSAAVRPLTAAGARLQSVITPADALLGLARSRQAFALPGGIEAYVALDATISCVALVRDGSLLSAHQLSWGYENRPVAPSGFGDPGPAPRRDDLAARLVDELTEFMARVGAERSELTQVSICGGLADLRTMTVPLMEYLDVEVETLDSLFGIDVEHLPEPAAEFRERAAELRLAWAAAADWRGPINLLRYHRRRTRRVALARAAVVAGVAAGLGTGWTIQQSHWWQATAPDAIGHRIARSETAPRQEVPTVAKAEPRAAPLITPAVGSPVARTGPTTSPSPVTGLAVTPPSPAVPAHPAIPPATAPALSSARPTSPGSTSSREPVMPVQQRPAATVATPSVVTPSVGRVPPTDATANPSFVASSVPPPGSIAKPVVVVPSAVPVPPAASIAKPVVVAPSVPPPGSIAKPVVVVPSVAPVPPPAAVTRPSVAPPPVPGVLPSTIAPTRPPPAITPTPALTPATAAAAGPQRAPTPPPLARPVAPPGPPADAVPVATTPVLRRSEPVARLTESIVRPNAPAAHVTAPPDETARVRNLVPAPVVLRRPAEPLPIPFDARLGTILYSPDRKLAIVNDRIVGPGDQVNGARILDITPTTVLLRDGQGRLRGLFLTSVGPSTTAP